MTAATNFSLMMGLEQQPTNTTKSTAAYNAWVAEDCQPNFYANAVNVSLGCPPYTPVPTPTYTPAPTTTVAEESKPRPANPFISRYNHGAART